MIQSRTDICSPSVETLQQLDSDILQRNRLYDTLDSTLLPLLGGDEDESSRYQSFRNDVSLAETPLAQQALLVLCRNQNLSDEPIYQLQRFILSSCLRMDRTAMEAIHLLPTKHWGKRTVDVGGTSQSNSILGVLDQNVTLMGRRLLEQWLRQPLVKLETIEARQSVVRYWVEEDSMGRDRLRQEGLMGFKGVDLTSLGYKLTSFGQQAEVGKCGHGGTTKALETLYKLHTLADRHVPNLNQILEDVRADHISSVGDERNICTAWNEGGILFSAYQGLRQVQANFQPAIALVETVLDMEHAPREFLVQPSHNEELIELRQELDQVEVELETIHADMDAMWVDVSGSSPGRVKLESIESTTEEHKNCSWQFRLLDTNAAKLLQTELADSVTVHKLLKNGIYFSTKALRQLGSHKQDLMTVYQTKQRTLVQQAMVVAGTYVPVIEQTAEWVSQLDVFASLAQVAATSAGGGYCCPQMTDGIEDRMGIELVGARHPCVELQETVDFIPNDVKLVFGESSFRIVTGPNMGGKVSFFVRTKRNLLKELTLVIFSHPH